MMQLLFLSGGEVFVVVLVALLLFGSKKIPEIARGLGKGMQEFRKATDEIKREITDNSGDFSKDVKEIKDEIDSIKKVI